MPNLSFKTNITNNANIFGLKQRLELSENKEIKITKVRTKIDWSFDLSYLEGDNGCTHVITIHSVASNIDYDIIENNKIISNELITFDSDTFNFELFSNIDLSRDEVKIKNVIIDFRRKVVTLE